jgi:translation initiation factor 4E
VCVPLRFVCDRYDDKSNAKFSSWDENRIQEFGMVGTLQAFWRLSESVLPPSALTPGSTYHFFRRGIKPTWEDPANVNGGRWVYFVAKDPAYVDFAWSRIQMGLVGCLIDVADHVNGIVCQRRRQGDRLSIWIRGDLTQDEILGVAKRTAEVLEYKVKKPGGGKYGFDFQAHPPDRASKVKSCQAAVTTAFGSSAVEQSLDNPAIRSLPPDAF